MTPEPARPGTAAAMQRSMERSRALMQRDAAAAQARAAGLPATEPHPHGFRRDAPAEAPAAPRGGPSEAAAIANRAVDQVGVRTVQALAEERRALAALTAKVNVLDNRLGAFRDSFRRLYQAAHVIRTGPHSDGGVSRAAGPPGGVVGRLSVKGSGRGHAGESGPAAGGPTRPSAA